MRGDDDHVGLDVLGEGENLRRRVTFPDDDVGRLIQAMLLRHGSQPSACIGERAATEVLRQLRHHVSRHLLDDIQEYQLAAIHLGHIAAQPQSRRAGFFFGNVDRYEYGLHRCLLRRWSVP